MPKYIVAIAVTGRVYIPVEPNQIPQMRESANQIVSDMDFGALQDIEWNDIHIETPTGEFIDTHIEPYPTIEITEETLDSFFKDILEQNIPAEDIDTLNHIKSLLQSEEQLSESKAETLIQAVRNDLYQNGYGESEYFSEFQYRLNQYLAFLHEWDHNNE